MASKTFSTSVRVRKYLSLAIDNLPPKSFESSRLRGDIVDNLQLDELKDKVNFDKDILDIKSSYVLSDSEIEEVHVLMDQFLGAANEGKINLPEIGLVFRHLGAFKGVLKDALPYIKPSAIKDEQKEP